MIQNTTTTPAHAKQPKFTTTVSEFKGGLLEKLTQKDSHGYMDGEDGVLSSHREASFQSGLRITGDEHKLVLKHGSHKQELYASLDLAPEKGSLTVQRDSDKLTVCDDGAIYLERKGLNGPVSEQFRIQDGQVQGMVNNYYGSYTPVEGSLDAQGKLHVHSIMEPKGPERVIDPMIPVTWFLSK